MQYNIYIYITDDDVLICGINISLTVKKNKKIEED